MTRTLKSWEPRSNVSEDFDAKDHFSKVEPITQLLSKLQRKNIFFNAGLTCRLALSLKVWLAKTFKMGLESKSYHSINNKNLKDLIPTTKYSDFFTQQCLTLFRGRFHKTVKKIVTIVTLKLRKYLYLLKNHFEGLKDTMRMQNFHWLIKTQFQKQLGQQKNSNSSKVANWKILK